jgi:hypothetical protein
MRIDFFFSAITDVDRFVFLWIPIVQNQWNLYNTDRNRNSLLYHDCLPY